MELQYIQVTITGQTPMMMHNDRMANPMNEYARRLREITGKRQKTDADHRDISQIEWLGGLYYNKEAGVYVPGRNVRKCVEEGAKKIKKGTTVKSAVFVAEELVPLIYDGPREPDKLFEHRGGIHVDTRTVGNQKARVVRTRPVFPQWALSFTFEYFPEQINAADLRKCVEIAGMLCGLGDYRPLPSGGSFGKFAVTAWSVA